LHVPGGGVSESQMESQTHKRKWETVKRFESVLLSDTDPQCEPWALGEVTA
jgi:hypothetical protein